MAEYKYVSLPTNGKEVRSENAEEHASRELNDVWVSAGWEPISVTRPSPIGQIGFLLRR